MGIVIILPLILVFRGPYERILDTMSHKVLEKFETSCLIEDVEDFHEFLGLRYKRIIAKNRKHKALYFFYLTSFYTYNKEFNQTDKLLKFLDGNIRFNISKIQVLNTEMLKKAIDGDFEKVEKIYIELCKSVDIEINKYKAGSNQITVLNQIKYTLGKFVEFTKTVNEETIQNARTWINKKANLYNAIDNYVIIKILEHNNRLEYIEEFKENLSKIDGNITFLKDLNR